MISINISLETLYLVGWLVDLEFYFPLNSYGHMEKGHRFKVSSERLEKPGIEPTTRPVA